MSINFLISSERSGSNFITKLLNGHSNICGPATKHVFNPVLRNLFRYSPLEDDSKWSSLIEDIYRLLSINFSVWKKEFQLKELENLAPKGDVKSLLRNIFLVEAREHGKQHVFVKENHVYEFLPYLILNFSESKYVCLVRDPRDMALSWKKNPVHPGGVIQAANQWKKDQQNLLKTHFLLKEKSILTTYEKLISQTEQETMKIVEFLGLSYEREMMEFYKDELTKENAKQQKAWNNLGKSVMSDNKNKYRKELTEKEIMYIEKICFYEMNELDYSPEFSLSVLESISNDEIVDFEKVESSKLKLKRPSGVIENMEAKKVFYRKNFKDNVN